MLKSKMKLLVVGPTKSHKTALSSFLGGLRETLDDYSSGPTIGCRILELERPFGVVQLWDVSGDVSAENTWPACRNGADGVLLVYDPDVPGNAKEAELWYSWFVTKRVDRECVACIALSATGASPGTPAPSLDGVQVESVPLNTEEGGPAARKIFDRLASRIAKRLGR